MQNLKISLKQLTTQEPAFFKVRSYTDCYFRNGSISKFQWFWLEAYQVRHGELSVCDGCVYCGEIALLYHKLDVRKYFTWWPPEHLLNEECNQKLCMVASDRWILQTEWNHAANAKWHAMPSFHTSLRMPWPSLSLPSHWLWCTLPLEMFLPNCGWCSLQVTRPWARLPIHLISLFVTHGLPEMIVSDKWVCFYEF